MAFQPSSASVVAFALQATLRTVLAVPARSVHYTAGPGVHKTASRNVVSRPSPHSSSSSAAPFNKAAERIKTTDVYSKSAIMRELKPFDPSRVAPEDRFRAMLAIQSIIEHYTPQDWSMLAPKHHRTLCWTWAAFFRIAQDAKLRPVMLPRQFDSIIYSLLKYPLRKDKGTDKWASMTISDVVEAMSWFNLVPSGNHLSAIVNAEIHKLPMTDPDVALGKQALSIWRQRRAVIETAQAHGIDFFNGHGALFNQTLREVDMLSRAVYHTELEDELREEIRFWTEQRQEMVDKRLEVLASQFKTLRDIQNGEPGTLRADDRKTTSPAALFLVGDSLIPGSSLDPFDLLRLMIGLTNEDAPPTPHQDPKGVASAFINIAGAYRRNRDIAKLTRLASLLVPQKFTTIRPLPLPPLSGQVYSSLLSCATNLRAFRRILAVLERAPRPSSPPQFNRSYLKLIRRRAQKIDSLSPNQWQKRLDTVFKRWGVGIPPPIFKRAAGPNDPIIEQFIQGRREQPKQPHNEAQV